MNYRRIAGGHEWNLENGATVRARNLDITQSGRLYADVQVMVDDGVLGGGHLELSSPQQRHWLAQDLANRNGAKPDVWDGVLLAIWYSLDYEQRGNATIFEPVSLAEVAEPGKMETIWGGLLAILVSNNLYGDSGQGKSSTIDGLLIHMTQGLPFLGLPTAQGLVVKLDWELNAEHTLRRWYPMARGVGLSAPPTDLLYQSLVAPMAPLMTDMVAWCANAKPMLIVVDSLGPAAGADPLNHDKMIDLMNQLRRLPATNLLIDHQSKPTGTQSYQQKRAFGSAYKGHLARSSLQLEMVSNVPGRASIVLRQQKNNFGPLADPIAFHIRYDGPTIRFEVADISEPEFQAAEALPAHLRIERYLQDVGDATKEDIMEKCGINSPQTFDNAVSQLRRAGKLPKDSVRGEGNKRVYQLD